jgi:transcriptional regulator with XRE-family HTH domain
MRAHAEKGSGAEKASMWKSLTRAWDETLVSVITYARMTAAAQVDRLEPVVIGARVKALRESSGLSLRDLSERSGVSAPMLSQVERGETSPTLTVAARIAAGLDLRLSQLLRLDEDGAVTVVRAADRTRGGNKRRGHGFEVLTSSQPGQRAEVSRHTLAPGGATGAPDGVGGPHLHEPGSRETALVERGSVVLVCDGQRYVLDKGDCVTFDADLPHHFENPSERDADAEFLAVVTAGLRRS